MQAMCAFDALALSPVTGQPVQISSCCAVTGTEISLYQQGDQFGQILPGRHRLAKNEWLRRS